MPPDGRTQRLVLATTADHPWAGKGPVSLAQLVNEPLIQRDPSSGTRHVLGQLLKKHGINPEQLKVVAEMGTTEAVRQAVKAGIGVAILSARAVADDLAHGSLVEIPISGMEIIRPFFLVTRKTRPSPIGRAFVRQLKDRAQQSPANPGPRGQE